MAHNGHAFNRFHRHDFAACLRRIFTPVFWKQRGLYHAAFELNQRRWPLRALLYVGLMMALDSADTLMDNFSCACSVFDALNAKRRRCGRTVAGFAKALGRSPMSFWRAVRSQIRQAATEGGLHPARVGRWLGFGIDGTKLNLPRVKALEKHYGVVTKDPGAPQLLVVAAVALGRQMLWDWRMCGAYGSERSLALELIRHLPPHAIAVLDAGFIGYEWGLKVLKSKRHFLVRVGANANLWAHGLSGTTQWRDGRVWLWPNAKTSQRPLVLRLIKLQRRVRKNKGDRRQFKTETLWLATDILDETALTADEARQLYALRWPSSEGGYRSWKMTLDARKLKGRTPLAVERECELSLCGMMLLQASILLQQGRAKALPSVAKGLRAWRAATRDVLSGKSTRWYGKALKFSARDHYHRQGRKRNRIWPRRKEHRQPRTPILLRLGARRKALGEQRLQEFSRASG